jgi:phosphohistidine swiveling domain-containing protein
MTPRLRFLKENHDVSIWPLCMVGEMLAYRLHRLAGGDVGPLIGEWKHRINRWALDPQGYNDLALRMVARVNDRPQWAWGVLEDLRRSTGRYLRFTTSVFRSKLALATDRQLVRLYETFHREYLRFYQLAWLPNILEGVDQIFTHHLLTRLEDRLTPHEATQALGLLLSPLVMTTRQQEEQDFLKMVADLQQLRGAQRQSALKQRLLRHHRKYCWIPFDYDGPAWTIQEVDQRGQEALQRTNAKKALQKRQQQRTKLRDDQRILEGKLRLDHASSDLIRFARTLLWTKDERKNVLYQSYYHLDFLIREMARRKGWTPVQLKHLLPLEMRKAMLTSRFNEEELNERIAYSVVVYEPRGMRLLASGPARSYVRSHVQSAPHVSQGSELHGECAYPGMARGVVRQIRSLADVSKMQKGEILVSTTTNPNLLPAIRKASAIVTDLGGITCHAAIISRELHIPCVIGTQNATRTFRDGETVEVDASSGCVKKLR